MLPSTKTPILRFKSSSVQIVESPHHLGWSSSYSHDYNYSKLIALRCRMIGSSRVEGHSCHFPLTGGRLFQGGGYHLHSLRKPLKIYPRDKTHKTQSLNIAPSIFRSCISANLIASLITFSILKIKIIAGQVTRFFFFSYENEFLSSIPSPSVSFVNCCEMLYFFQGTFFFLPSLNAFSFILYVEDELSYTKDQ